MTYYWLGFGPMYPIQPEPDHTCPECGARPVAWGDWLCTQCRERLEASLEDPERVECPACGGQGVVFPGATVRMWAGLVPFSASPEVCDLCGGEGEVEPVAAARWEAEQLGME